MKLTFNGIFQLSVSAITQYNEKLLECWEIGRRYVVVLIKKNIIDYKQLKHFSAIFIKQYTIVKVDQRSPNNKQQHYLTVGQLASNITT